MKRRTVMALGLLAPVAMAAPLQAAKSKASKSVAEATAAELKEFEQAHFRAIHGLEGVLNGGESREAPAGMEIEAWVKAWVTPKFELRPMGVKSGDPLDQPGGARVLKGSAARRGLVEALAAVRKGAFGKVERSQVAAKVDAGPELPPARNGETLKERQERLAGANQIILTYGRRSTDERGNPLPDITTLPDGTKVALNQLASFTHTFAAEWRLTEAGWKIAAVEVLGATAIL